MIRKKQAIPTESPITLISEKSLFFQKYLKATFMKLIITVVFPFDD